MSATPIFSNKHCEVVWFDIGRQWTAREEQYMRNKRYDPGKTPWNNPNKDNKQLNIIVFDDNNNKLGELVYTTWAFSSCSSATISGITKGVYSGWTDEAHWKPIVADVIEAILACEKSSSYPPHRFFCNVPRNNSKERLWYWLLHFCFPKGLEPSYNYENRAHKSAEQHLYDVNTDVLAKWMKDYHESIKPKPAVVATGPVVNQPVPVLARVGGDWLDEFVGGDGALVRANEPTPVGTGSKL